jgi:hypothetical protein
MSRTSKSVEERFWSKVDKRSSVPCWIWTGATSKQGYGNFQLSKIHGKAVFMVAHKVAWLLTHGELPENNLCHHCDVGICVRPKHLFPGTQAENLQDMVRKGRHRGGPHTGAEHHLVRRTGLDWDKVHEIRRRAAEGERHVDLVNCFRVCSGTISNIVQCVTWREPGMPKHVRRSINSGMRCGDGHPSTRRTGMTMAKVRRIRKRVARGERRRALAQEYGVCLQTISNIVNNVRWKEST